MKPSLWTWGSVAAVVSLASCMQVTSPDPGGARTDRAGRDESFQLAYGARHQLRGGVEIGFRNVLLDCRCPSDAVCVWQGVADIQLWLREQHSDSELVEVCIPGLFWRSDSTRLVPVVARGYAIRLVKLDPYPRVDTPVPVEQYVAHLWVQRIGPGGSGLSGPPRARRSPELQEPQTNVVLRSRTIPSPKMLVE